MVTDIRITEFGQTCSLKTMTTTHYTHQGGWVRFGLSPENSPRLAARSLDVILARFVYNVSRVCDTRLGAGRRDGEI
jgi:hypothetical protein